MTQEDVWNHNKRAIVDYVPKGKDLKLIWESDPKTEKIVETLGMHGDLAVKESISFSFCGRKRTLELLNIASKNIRQFQDRVRALPDSFP
jgi:hypothetical protein